MVAGWYGGLGRETGEEGGGGGRKGEGRGGREGRVWSCAAPDFTSLVTKFDVFEWVRSLNLMCVRSIPAAFTCANLSGLLELSGWTRLLFFFFKLASTRLHDT